MDLHSILFSLFSHAPRVGMQGIVQFVFSPDDVFVVDIANEVSVTRGRHTSANTEIALSREHLLGILGGTANIEQLFAAGSIKIGGDLGLATLLPQIIEHALDADAQATPAVNMNTRYPVLARFSEKISAQQLPLTHIERRPRTELSIKEFQTRYVQTGTPLIISEALFDWPLFRMSREESMQHFANLNGITRHGDYVSNAFSTKRDFRTTTMSEFIGSLDENTSENGEPAAYMGNNIVPTPLLDMISAPRYFDQSRYIAPRIWIGPKGTLTPLHRDDSDNLFAQVWGKKSFILAAPHHREALGTWSTSPQGGLEGCDFKPEQPDYEKFPHARAVPLLRFTLEAGDMLFLPEGWFHQVESLSTSLSVNFWIDSGRGGLYPAT